MFAVDPANSVLVGGAHPPALAVVDILPPTICPMCPLHPIGPMLSTMECQIAPNPLQVGFFGALGLALDLHQIPHLIQQSG